MARTSGIASKDAVTIKASVDAIMARTVGEIRSSVNRAKTALPRSKLDRVEEFPPALENLTNLSDRAAALFIAAKSLFSRASGYVGSAMGDHGGMVSLSMVLQSLIDEYDGSLERMKSVLEGTYGMLPSQAEAISKAFVASDTGGEDREVDWLRELKKGFNLPPSSGGGI